MSPRSIPGCLGRTLAALAALGIAATPVASVQAQAARPASFQIPKIPHERYTLPNGMTVILSQDRSVPVVGMTIWYHVGSKNEKPGRTGFAHLFEHVMFEGSQHAADGMHFGIVEEIGGELNATTSNDRT